VSKSRNTPSRSKRQPVTRNPAAVARMRQELDGGSSLEREVVILCRNFPVSDTRLLRQNLIWSGRLLPTFP
jgi:hypothetical protein